MLLVVMVRTRCYDDVSVDTATRACTSFGVTERPGVRLPASPPPWASTSRWTEVEKCCKNCSKPEIIAATMPAKQGPPCTAALCVTRLCCATGVSNNGALVVSEALLLPLCGRPQLVAA